MRNHGIFRGGVKKSRISLGAEKFVGGDALIFTKFLKGECNFSQSSQVKRKGKFSTSGGVGGAGGGGYGY